MDNRSIATFIETSKSLMNSVIIVCLVKVQAKKNASTLNTLTRKGGDQGKEVGIKSSLSRRVIETNGKHMACHFT